MQLLLQLAKQPTLEEVNLSRTGLTDKCAPGLAKLVASKSIRVVIASYCKFTAKGVKLIADALVSCSLKVSHDVLLLCDVCAFSCSI